MVNAGKGLLHHIIAYHTEIDLLFYLRLGRPGRETHNIQRQGRQCRLFFHWLGKRWRVGAE